MEIIIKMSRYIEKLPIDNKCLKIQTLDLFAIWIQSFDFSENEILIIFCSVAKIIYLYGIQD